MNTQQSALIKLQSKKLFIAEEKYAALMKKYTKLSSQDKIEKFHVELDKHKKVDNIIQSRRETLNKLKEKETWLPRKTYYALMTRYNEVTSSKLKLNKFKLELDNYTRRLNTKAKLREEKQTIFAEKKAFRNILHGNKKNISFFLSFYVPIKEGETHLVGGVMIPKPAYKGNDTIVYQNSKGEDIKCKCVSLKTSGNSGSYFLERQATMNALFLMSNLKNYKMVATGTTGQEVRINVGKYEEYISILRDFEGFKDFYDNLNNAEYAGTIIIVMTGLKIDTAENTPLNYATAQAFDDGVACHTISLREYTTIPKGLKMIYQNGYVKDNYIPQSCWLTLLLNLFKSPIESKYKKANLTYESIHNILAPEREFSLERNGYAFNEVVNFFKLWKVALYMFDCNENIQQYYEPEARNKNINLTVIYVVYSDRHIYHLNHNLKRLEQKLEEKLISRAELCPVPNSKFSLTERDEDINTRMVNTFDELFAILDDETEEKDIHILYNKPSCFDLFYRFYKLGVKPSIQMTNGEVCFKFMRLDNFNDIKGLNIIISTLHEEGVYDHKEFDTEEIFRHYTSVKNNVINNMLTINYKSVYHLNVKTMLDSYYKSPLKGQFDTPFPYSGCRGYELDFNKYYTSILMYIKHIPVINSFDEFKDYNDEPIEDYNFYFVEKLNSSQIYPFHKLSICQGINICDVTGIRIISVLQVSKLKVNTAGEVIKRIYEDEKLSPKMKKDLINHQIGVYDKGTNKRNKTGVFKYRDEALALKEEFGGRVIPLECGEDEELFIHHIENVSDLSEGFRLISLMVYDTAHKHLLTLKEKIESYGLEVYKCNTDCLHIEKDEEKLGEFMADHSEIFEFKCKDDYDAIGKLKVKEVDLYETSPIRSSHYENIYDLLPKTNMTKNDIELMDEFNRDEISDKITDRTIALSVVAGGGKTSSHIYNIVKRKEKALIVTPFNALCLELSNKFKELETNGEIYSEQIESITLNKLFGLAFDGVENKQTKGYCVDGIQRIVFDEIYLNNTFMLSRIKEYMAKHPDILFNATGDEYQLSPIEELCVKDPKQYYNNIMVSMFPNRITFQENKRCKTDEDRAKIKALAYEIRTMTDKKEQMLDIFKKYGINVITKQSDITTKRNVCAMNATCEWVNNIVYKKNHAEAKYFVGQDLICRKTLKGKGYKTFVNYTYTITSISDEFMGLDDGDNQFQLPLEMIYKYFILSYAQTCHSLQGMSVDEGITIFDIYSFMVNPCWIYTAITRATAIENINVYVAYNDCGRGELFTQIDSMISGHINADINADRDINMSEYVSRKWVMEKLKKVKTCLYCKKQLDTTCMECFSIDRIDNNLAHTESNCQIICRRCNVAKK